MTNKSKILLPMLVTLAIAGCSSSNTQTDTQEPIVPKVNKLAAAKTNVQLGFYYIQQGNYQRAQAKLLTALREAPSYPPANSAMGYLLETTGEADNAKEYYVRAIKLDPHDGGMHNNYGTFLCRHKHYTEALQEFKIAITDKNYINTSGTYENAGLCAQQIPNTKLAQHFFLKAIQRNPALPTSLLALAEINYNSKQYAKANDYLNQYLQVASPTKAATQLKLAINKKLKVNA